MPLLLVALLSLLVGAVVYVGTLRRDQSPSASGFGDEEEVEEIPAPATRPGAASDGPDPGYTYLQVSTQGPRVRDRLAGILGVIVLLGVGAAALALVLYELGHLINRTIEAFLD
jgi:hypothetical protein